MNLIPQGQEPSKKRPAIPKGWQLHLHQHRLEAMKRLTRAA